MAEMYFCVTVDDVGLDGYSTPEHLGKLLNFWNEQNLKGTLFVVPRCNDVELGEMKEYVELLKGALANGHEIAQHGLDHTRFQTGIPPKMVLDLPHEGPARKYLSKNREEIENNNSVENLRAVLREGRDILESALSIKVKGFRAPCLSVCENLFKAFDAEGYLYDSSCVFQEAAWGIINNPDENADPLPISRDRFDAFQICDNTRVFPISAEYTWYLKRKDYDTFLNLAKHDFDACLHTGIPFVSLCHVSPVQEGDEDCGYDFYRELIDYARNQAEKYNVPFVAETLSKVCGKVSNLF